MIKLTQRAWNNVIIISTLVLILLFNFSSNWLNDGANLSPAEQGLIPHGLVITTIEFEHHNIERIGQGWRSTIAGSNNQNLNELVEFWRQSKIVPAEEPLNLARAKNMQNFNVKIWFAGQAEPIEYDFLSDAEQNLVIIDNQTFRLVRPTVQNLTLPE